MSDVGTAHATSDACTAAAADAQVAQSSRMLVYAGACDDIAAPFLMYIVSDAAHQYPKNQFNTLVCMDGLPNNNYYWMYGTDARMTLALITQATAIPGFVQHSRQGNRWQFDFTHGYSIVYYINTSLPLDPVKDAACISEIANARGLYVSGYEPGNEDDTWYQSFPKLETVIVRNEWTACRRNIPKGVTVYHASWLNHVQYYWSCQSTGLYGVDTPYIVQRVRWPDLLLTSCHATCCMCKEMERKRSGQEAPSSPLSDVDDFEVDEDRNRAYLIRSHKNMRDYLIKHLPLSD
jgi:hypothetical protein